MHCTGFVTLSPFQAAQVCVGQQLELTCITNETAVVWNFVPPLVDDQGAPISLDWFIFSTDLDQQLQQFGVNSTTFTFVRTSMRNSSPLVSTLNIINSSSALNMTTVSCMKIVNRQRAIAVFTTIVVVGNTHTGLMSLHRCKCSYMN